MDEWDRGPRARMEDELDETTRLDHRDDIFSRMADYAGIAPIFPNDFDEENAFTGIAEMAGFGDPYKGGHDALDGVDRMVTGETDAMAELHVHSATAGGPLALDPFESIYSDDAGFEDLDPSLPLNNYEDPGYWDWTTHYNIQPEEMA